MKNLFINIVAFGVVALLLGSCKKDLPIVTTNGGIGGTLSVSASTLVLQKASLKDTTKIIKFSFNNADYGVSTVVTNTLQIDKVSDNWATPTSVVLASGVFNQGYSTADFNTLLLKLGLAGGVSTPIQARIMYSASANLASVYSNVVTINATPFYVPAWLYIVGAFNGYSTTTPDSLLSAKGDGIYTGVINFPSSLGQFLILPAKSFTNKYSTTTATTVTSSVVVYNAANNLVGPAAAGQTIITFNLNTLTISFASANTYSVFGSTTATDADLTKYVNDGNTGWTGTIAMTTGAFKFRQNHAATYNWGDVSPADGKNATNASGTDIPVTVAGSYKVSFNIPLSSTGTVPSTTATYTLVKQ